MKHLLFAALLLLPTTGLCWDDIESGDAWSETRTKLNTLGSDLETHEADTTNPHSVTAAQAGAAPYVEQSDPSSITAGFALDTDDGTLWYWDGDSVEEVGTDGGSADALTATAGSDINITMGDDAGVNKVLFKDSSSALVADINSDGRITTYAADGERRVELSNNSSISATAGDYEIYSDAGEIKLGEDGTERSLVVGTSRVQLLVSDTEPATPCNDGDLWVDTNGTTGQRLYVCEDGSSWVVSAGSGTEVASGTATLGTSAIADDACATVVTVSATNVATTDVISWGFNSDPTSTTGYNPSGDMLMIIAYPTANNVNFKVCNKSGSSITPGAVTLNWRVDR